MNKKYFIGSIIVLVVVVVFIVFKPTTQKEVIQNDPVSVKDYKNSSYIIEGQSITLTDGFSEIESAPSSASKIVTRYFGNEARHDLNDDGREDIVFILTQERGGSGKFFYAVASLNTPTRYIGSNAFLLGDRIAPQSTNIDEGITTQGTTRENVIVVNFMTREPSESFTTEPTVGKSVWIKLNLATMQFGEVAQNFEGESQ